MPSAPKLNREVKYEHRQYHDRDAEAEKQPRLSYHAAQSISSRLPVARSCRPLTDLQSVKEIPFSVFTPTAI